MLNRITFLKVELFKAPFEKSGNTITLEFEDEKEALSKYLELSIQPIYKELKFYGSLTDKNQALKNAIEEATEGK